MKRTPTPVTQAPRNIEERIGHRAYELYVGRGREEGHGLDDWLRAESEITGKAAKAATSRS